MDFIAPFRFNLSLECLARPVPTTHPEFHRWTLRQISKRGRYWADSWADAKDQYHTKEVNIDYSRHTDQIQRV